MSEKPVSPNEGYRLEDWQNHYDTGDLKWDLEAVAPPFLRLWEEGRLVPGKAMIPGCGRGHEVVFLAEKGFDVTGLDFAPGAVAHLTGALKDRNLSARVLHQDFFSLNSSHHGVYDLMVEHTFFCAIHPSKRPDYVALARRILKKDGLLAALFYETGEAGGPPYNTTRDEVVRCFSPDFLIDHLEKTPHSAERRKNKEWLALLRKK